jgi:hypothetical protein
MLATERDFGQLVRLAADLKDRDTVAGLNLERAVADQTWNNAGTRRAVKTLRATLSAYEFAVAQFMERIRSGPGTDEQMALREAGRRAFAQLATAISEVAAINDKSTATLPRLRGDESEPASRAAHDQY